MSPDTEQTKTTNSYQFNGNVNGKKASKKARDESEELYKGPGGAPLPAEILDELGTFSKKHTKAVIDVWWLYDDGGLTLLLPYIISTRRNFGACKLRVFALTNKMAELEFEQRSMASLLAKFRIDYSDLKLLPDVTKKPKEESVKFFDSLIKDFKSDNPDEESAPGTYHTLDVYNISTIACIIGLALIHSLSLPSFRNDHGKRADFGAGQNQSIFANSGAFARTFKQIGPGGDDVADAAEEHCQCAAVHGVAGLPEPGHASVPVCARQSDQRSHLLLVDDRDMTET